MSAISFSRDFLFGAATAAYQIEGAVSEDGRGPCIWDSFSHQPGRTRDGDTGDIACDHYHRMDSDVRMMQELGLEGYRFSIAWSRVLPSGKGRPNPQGLDFYNRLVDRLLQAGIAPSATLYHWDLPQALQDKGGWENRDIVGYFADYAELMYRTLGDRVKRWYTHNEPWVVAWAGHQQGRHAPGIAHLPSAVQVCHHLLLSHAKAVETYRQTSPAGGEIGIVLNLYPTVAATDSPADQRAATLADGFHNRWFLDPIYRGSYPLDFLEHLAANGVRPTIQPGDLDFIAAQGMDFLGINYYFRKVTQATNADPVLCFQDFKPVGAPYTEMNWEVWPDGLYDLLVRLKMDYGDPRMLVTENGAAFADPPAQAGIIEDNHRRDFLEGHFRAAARAIANGVRLEGFYVWSLMDNFEWAQGYSKRFGIIGVDYQNQVRTWKRSAHWYKQLIATRTIPATLPPGD